MDKIHIPINTPLANSTRINCSTVSVHNLNITPISTQINSVKSATSSTAIHTTSSNTTINNLPLKPVIISDEKLELKYTNTSSSISNASKDSAISMSSISSITYTTSTSSTIDTKEKSSEIAIGKSVRTKKPKAHTVRRTSLPAKPSSDVLQPVDKILKEINMTKYSKTFKKIDLEKFKQLQDIDLNAFGITRPSEIKIFKVAIKNLKNSKYF